jgi:hypothetical protein
MRLAIVFLALLGGACSAPQAQRSLFAPTPDSPIAVAGAPGSVVIGEVNGDAEADLMVASARGGSPLATGKGSWQLALGDVNGDGKADVVTSDVEGSSVTVLLAQ